MMAALAEPRDERHERRLRVIDGIDEQDRLAALPGRGVGGHPTVALEDHPRLAGVDELADLLADTAGAPDQAASSASPSAIRAGRSAGVARRSIRLGCG